MCALIFYLTKVKGLLIEFALLFEGKRRTFVLLFLMFKFKKKSFKINNSNGVDFSLCFRILNTRYEHSQLQNKLSPKLFQFNLIFKN